VAQRATNNPLLCPAKALFRLTQHLRDHQAPPDAALCDYYDSSNKLSSTPSTFITNGLRHSAVDLQATSGINARLLSARSLRPGGATTLRCANIDKDAIQLLGGWKSDAMLEIRRHAPPPAHASPL
jgi:integrase